MNGLLLALGQDNVLECLEILCDGGLVLVYAALELHDGTHHLALGIDHLERLRHRVYLHIGHFFGHLRGQILHGEARGARVICGVCHQSAVVARVLIV